MNRRNLLIGTVGLGSLARASNTADLTGDKWTGYVTDNSDGPSTPKPSPMGLWHSRCRPPISPELEARLREYEELCADIAYLQAIKTGPRLARWWFYCRLGILWIRERLKRD